MSDLIPSLSDAMDSVREFHDFASLPPGDLATADPRDDAFLQWMGFQLLGFAERLKHDGHGPKGMRARLMVEELGELVQAMASGDEVEVADGLADLVYVVLGTAVEFSVPLPEVFAEVHRSNLTKFPTCTGCNGSGCETCGGRGRLAFRDEAGKIVKPPSYEPPKIGEILEEYRPWREGEWCRAFLEIGGVQTWRVSRQDAQDLNDGENPIHPLRVLRFERVGIDEIVSEDCEG